MLSIAVCMTGSCCLFLFVRLCVCTFDKGLAPLHSLPLCKTCNMEAISGGCMAQSLYLHMEVKYLSLVGVAGSINS